MSRILLVLSLFATLLAIPRIASGVNDQLKNKNLPIIVVPPLKQ